MRLARELQPDVILMDFSMPRMNGLEATRAIHGEHPGIRIIGLSMYEEAEQLAAMRAAGAAAYVTKSGPPDALLRAIREQRA
jgi:DNA-binding NarL/FixJ family response regulator